MLGNLRQSSDMLAPYIKIDVEVRNPGYINGVPNKPKKDERYVLAPSAKKIGTYIRNQLFGSDLLTQTDGLSINWLMPSLSEALELSIYERESFIYIHKYDGKIYLECIKKCYIHNLVQRYDKIISCEVIQDYETPEHNFSLHRKIALQDGNSFIEMVAYRKDKKASKWEEIPIELFNKMFGTEYKRVYELPYEVIVNIDVGQDFFKDSVKLLAEEVEIYNTLCEEVQKTKTRIATTQHYQSGDIYTQWQPSANMYDVRTLTVGGIQDFFTLLPGDKDHHMFEFLQGNLRITDYVDAFKFIDYQVIQMANLSPATFGYEKDNYQNVASVDLSMNLTEMTIEAIKKQIEPQINKLIEQIIKLQELLDVPEEQKIPKDLIWDYGNNEKLTDDKKIGTLQAIQRTMSVPYSTRAKIITPILNKLLDTDISDEELVNEYNNAKEEVRLDFGEI